MIYFFRDRFFSDVVEWLDLLFFYVVSVFTMSFALTPTTLVAMLTGYFFGWHGLIPLLLAYMLACLLGWQIGRLLFRFFVGNRLLQHNKLQDFFARLERHEFLLVFYGRLSPVLPFAMMNIAFASIKLHMDKYLLASIAGAFPRLFLFFYVGISAVEIWEFVLHPTLRGGLSVVPVILVIISTIGLVWIFKDAIQSYVKNQSV